MSNTPSCVVAWDPGDEHVGLSGWLRGGEVYAREIHHTEAVGTFYGMVREAARSGVVLVMVWEEYVLYPWAAVEQSWSPMLTAQMIGAFRFICESNGVQYAEQGANIKKPIAGQLRGRGIQRVGQGTHARDAELHLYYYLLKEDVAWRT